MLGLVVPLVSYAASRPKKRRQANHGHYEGATMRRRAHYMSVGKARGDQANRRLTTIEFAAETGHAEAGMMRRNEKEGRRKIFAGQ